MSAPLVHFESPQATLWHGDCIETMRLLPDASVDAVVTDPPYGIAFMGKQWDQPGEFGSTKRDGSGPNKRRGAADAALEAGTYDLSTTAMRNFQRWCEAWAAECLRVLKPGGHLLAFGGSRTWHRLAAGIEDAGFEIRDSIAWLYGSGFPKSMDVSKAIDKVRNDRDASLAVAAFLAASRDAAGLTNRDIDAHFGYSGMAGHWTAGAHMKIVQVPKLDQWDELRTILGFGAEMDAEVWRLNGRKGTPGEAWATAEVLGVDRRMNEPSGIVGVGQGQRVEVERQLKAANSEDARRWQGWGTALKPAFEPIVVGRKPLAGTVAANVLAHGTGALNIAASRVGDGSESQGARPTDEASAVRRYAEAGAVDLAATPGPRGGSPDGRWPTNVLLDQSQATALDAQSGTLTSGKLEAHHTRNAKESGILGAYGSAEGARGYGDSGGASRFFPTFDFTAEDLAWLTKLESLPTFRYEAKASTAERPSVGGVEHPTVKPRALMEWLVRLVTQPGGTVLEPFSGSGTTLEAAVREGFTVIGIEREADYLPLIVQRLTERDHQQSLFGDWDA